MHCVHAFIKLEFHSTVQLLPMYMYSGAWCWLTCADWTSVCIRLCTERADKKTLELRCWAWRCKTFKYLSIYCHINSHTRSEVPVGYRGGGGGESPRAALPKMAVLRKRSDKKVKISLMNGVLQYLLVLIYVTFENLGEMTRPTRSSEIDLCENWNFGWNNYYTAGHRKFQRKECADFQSIAPGGTLPRYATEKFEKYRKYRCLYDNNIELTRWSCHLSQ